MSPYWANAGAEAITEINANPHARRSGLFNRPFASFLKPTSGMIAVIFLSMLWNLLQPSQFLAVRCTFVSLPKREQQSFCYECGCKAPERRCRPNGPKEAYVAGVRPGGKSRQKLDADFADGTRITRKYSLKLLRNRVGTSGECQQSRPEEQKEAQPSGVNPGVSVPREREP